MHLRLVGVSVLLLLTAIWPQPASADGKAFAGPDRALWKTVTEHTQTAVILHKNGIERLILAVGFVVQQDDHACWIVPVPGRPDEVKVAIQNEFPRVSGRSIRAIAYDHISSITTLAGLTQIYPIIGTLALANLLEGRAQVFSSAEGFGLRSVVITADSTQGLAEHLLSRNARVEPALLDSFLPYLDGKHALVVTTIASPGMLKQEFGDQLQHSRLGFQRFPCLEITFPCEQAFFPLKASRSDDPNETEVTLFLEEWQEAAAQPLFPMKTSEYRGRISRDKMEEGNLLASGKYTRISFKAKPSTFTADLTFLPSHRFAHLYLEITGSAWFFWPCLLFAMIPLAGIISGVFGFILFRRWKQFMYLGFWNGLTVFAMWVRMKDQDYQVLFEGRKIGSSDSFLVLFSLVYLFALGMMTWLLTLPMM